MRQQGVFLASVLLMSGCGGPSAYQRVFQDEARPANRRTLAAPPEAVWGAVKRAALALNFSVDDEDQRSGRLAASRLFQDGRKTTTIQLHVNVEPQGAGQATVFLNAIEASDRLFTRSHRRFFLWIVPLPGGGGVEANRVTEAERTIEDQAFYDSFFSAVDRELQMGQSG